MDQLEYLESERQKIWKKIIELDELIQKKTSDYEKEAQQASRKTSEFRNKTEKAKGNAEQFLSECQSILEELRTEKESLKKLNTSISRFYHTSKGNSEALQKDLDELTRRKSELENQINAVEEIYAGHEELVAQIGKLSSISTQASDLFNKINTLHKQAISRKEEVDSLYYEIHGYDEEGAEGEEDTHVEGIKDKLDSTFEQLESDFQELGKKVEKIENESKTNYDNFITSKDDSFEKKIKTWNSEYSRIKEQIESLLPNALTAGLSHAYSEKKVKEESDSKKLRTQFYVGIFFLVLVSLIPFLVSINLLKEGKEISEVLLDLPRLVISILPLYVPVMWLAYSANKKLNLSKRLIEEYTHKEVLSKTFEGLSRQIDELEDHDYDVSSELRIKLLFNIMEVSSENPGKLISDYNKSDHPLMDALDKSAKLSKAVDKLTGIPGMSKLTEILEKRQKRILNKELAGIDEALESTENESENA
ncbi:hypothetical protein BFP72_11175 [Reichenbachiella sp. 5M10]|uniref:hypothetical protein n=1 Tax=Reichenbachiella sp. 5M10 TaxID=1889772 RepID=UPI000C144F4D|nr:hypothetical protein [Reichenbachiella sp. 5M10]PIB35913.1 hypothetical protein BFP72_11175 [Reichenbachiella sp. 5M10]